MKLLIVTQVVDTEHPILGFFHRWISEFAKHFETIHVIALQVGKYDLPENVFVHSLGKEEAAGRFEYIKRFYEYVWKYRNEYDSVFVHMNQEYVLLAGVLWKVLGKKIYLWYTHKHVGLRLRLSELFVTKIFSASKESFRLKTKKLIVTGHGIDTTQFENMCPVRDSKKIRLITIGRISPVKQYEVLIDAVAKLQQKGLPVTLSIIGGVSGVHEEEYLQDLKNKSKDLPVVFHGAVPHSQISEYLRNSDIFLNVSKTGSLDKAVLEAMAAGVIPVTSNEGLTSTLGDMKELLYVKGEDMASRIEELFSLSEKQWADMQKKVQTIVIKQHSLQALITNLAKEIR